MLDFNGRGRSRQLELAKSFGWEDYPTPAGGCLLTDIQFSARIKDLLAHETFETSDTLILKNGRHFRLDAGAKLVLGRNEHENDFLERVQSSKYLSLHVKELNAPSGLLSATASEEERMEACKILLSYTKANDTEFYNIDVGETSIHACAYPSRDKAKKYLI